MQNYKRQSKRAARALSVLLPFCLAAACSAADAPAEKKAETYRIMGLFSQDRVADLKESAATLQDARLEAVDFDKGEVTFSYDPQAAFKGLKPDDIRNRIDNQLKNASSHTFGLKPLSTTAPEKLEAVKIEILGLDCKGCSYAAYQAVANIPGVEYAIASFKEGLVVARIDPAQTNREALIKSLKQRGAEIKETAEAKPEKSPAN
jgi:copper chaperone CopZ